MIFNKEKMIMEFDKNNEMKNDDAFALTPLNITETINALKEKPSKQEYAVPFNKTISDVVLRKKYSV